VAYEVGNRSIPAARTTPEAPEIHAFFEKMRAMDCDSAVMEVSSHALALQRTVGIKFAIAVFTNLTQDHLDYHLDMESYFAEKAKLFTAAQACVINLDDPWGRKLVKNGCMSYGFSEQAKVRATHEKLGAHGTRFRVETPWGEIKIQLSLLGRFNIHNALAAIATGGLLGISLEAMAKSLANLPHVPGRLEEVPNRKHKTVFVDYAHTDDALHNVLETLREICKGKLIVLFGCGGNRDRGKRKKMGQVAAELADYSIVTSDNPRKEDPQEIVDEILTGFTSAVEVEVVLDRREAIERGLQKMGRRDIFLVAGKGHETYQELRDTTIPFNDRETIQELLG
jgi:UDP-N-acetylmuramoyl-L-alanyl-D-glutamate--2,6-diaminopimelate ligase